MTGAARKRNPSHASHGVGLGGTIEISGTGHYREFSRLTWPGLRCHRKSFALSFGWRRLGQNSRKTFMPASMLNEIPLAVIPLENV